MLILDSRERTEMLRYFTPFDIEVAEDSPEFDAGDFVFDGNGADGPIQIGIERKKTRDLVNSMRDRRLHGFQAPLLAETYEVRYLVHEGITQCGQTGALEEMGWSRREKRNTWVPVTGRQRQAVLWRELDSYLASLEEFFGIRVRSTNTPAQTAAFVVSRYHYWQKPYKQHKTGKQVYAPEPTRGTSKKARFISLESHIRQQYGEEAVYCWKMAAQLPGVDSKAEEVAKFFRSGMRMCRATVNDWMCIPGVGKTTAMRIVEVIKGVQPV